MLLVLGIVLELWETYDSSTVVPDTYHSFFKVTISDTFTLKNDKVHYLVNFNNSKLSFNREISKESLEEMIGDADSIESDVYSVVCFAGNNSTVTLYRVAALGEKDFDKNELQRIKFIVAEEELLRGVLKKQLMRRDKLESLRKFVSSDDALIETTVVEHRFGK